MQWFEENSAFTCLFAWEKSSQLDSSRIFPKSAFVLFQFFSFQLRCNFSTVFIVRTIWSKFFWLEATQFVDSLLDLLLRFHSTTSFPCTAQFDRGLKNVFDFFVFLFRTFPLFSATSEAHDNKVGQCGPYVHPCLRPWTRNLDPDRGPSFHVMDRSPPSMLLSTLPVAHVAC